MEKQYAYIEIKPTGGVAHKRPVYGIYNRKSDDLLGWLTYYPAWRQYVFSAKTAYSVFNESCLRDIIDFLGILKKAKGVVE